MQDIDITPIQHVNLADEGLALGSTGYTVAVALPSGIVYDIWFYDTPATTSADVRIRASKDDVNGNDPLPVRKVIKLPGMNDLPVRAVAVVAR